MQEKIISIIASQLNKKVEDITLDTNLTTDLGADSLDFVELLMAFEEEYNIVVSDDDAVNLHTVGDVVNYISAKASK